MTIRVSNNQPNMANTQPNVASTQPNVASTQPNVANTLPNVANTQPNVATQSVNLTIPSCVKNILPLICENNCSVPDCINKIIDETMLFLPNYPHYPRLGIDTISGKPCESERNEKEFAKGNTCIISVELSTKQVQFLRNRNNSTGIMRYNISMSFLLCVGAVISKKYLFDEAKALADKMNGTYTRDGYYLRTCSGALVTSVGAKYSVRNCIRNLIPDDVECIFEGFGRTAAMTVHSGRYFPQGIVNELQEGWYNLLYVLKNYPVMLYFMLKSNYYAVNPKRHDDIQNEPVSKYDSTIDSMVKRAADLVYLCNTSYRGMDGDIFDDSATAERLGKAIEMIFYYSYKLQNVRITNSDVEGALIGYYGRKRTLIFLDPPYFSTKQYNANNLREKTSDSFAERQYLHLNVSDYSLIWSLCENLITYLCKNVRLGKLTDEKKRKKISNIVNMWLNLHCDRFLGSNHGIVNIPKGYGKSDMKIYEITAQFVKHCVMMIEANRFSKAHYILVCHYENEPIEALYKKLGFKPIGYTGSSSKGFSKKTVYYGNEMLYNYVKQHFNWSGEPVELKTLK